MNNIVIISYSNIQEKTTYYTYILYGITCLSIVYAIIQQSTLLLSFTQALLLRSVGNIHPARTGSTGKQ